jgi:hypothetical protein
VKPIPQYEDLYSIAEDGRIYSLPRKDNMGRDQGGIFLSPKYDTQGYVCACLCKDGKHHYHRIHRIMAMVYMTNFSGKETINHIDGDKKNNHIANLELSNSRHNIDHKMRVLNKKERWGVIKVSSRKLFKACIRNKGFQETLGYSEDKEFLYDLYKSRYFELHGCYPW